MNWLCRWLGLHTWEDLTPEHGFDIHVGGLDDEFDPAQFLHAKRCTRCGKLHAIVSDSYWSRHKPDFLRTPDESEIRMFLIHLETHRRKTATTGRMPTPEDNT